MAQAGIAAKMKLKDLAQHLGLSQTTVSRALNGYPEVKEATRLVVAEAADRLGYRPNASARRLATGRVGAVGFVLRSPSEFGPHTTEFIAGLSRSLAAEGLDILLSTVESHAQELDTYRKAAASRTVDAVVLHSPRLHDARVDLLLDLGIPFVLHGRTNVQRPHAWLDIDNQDAMQRATAHLMDLGHRRIALLNGLAGLTYAEHREAGYRAALAARGVAADPALIANAVFTDEAGFRLAQAMLALEDRPTAFLPGSMMSALGVSRAIRQAGLELGREVSMIAHDDVFPYLNADTMYPTLTTTRSSMRAAGTRIGELVASLLNGKPAAAIGELWPVDLVLRQSSAPPR